MELLLEQALEFERKKITHMTTSDRVSASREAKNLVLNINKIYKKTRDPRLMEIMKKITVKKRKIEKRLRGLVDTI
ncbi:hypothetical protein U6A24_09990 [Aquimarina gracilis]|uniref:Uncharacterized protein n=1 Tax=Aquimarina gracilis TaxID=874422 RepID=A0ABU5ZUU5_9FLAO|nr:hypothetical protein [Aquimarina gracilis]MEB3345793.1 hypothetical protein [Aquimarina gracilis]